ncbi:deoxyribose-phosphate aldolase [bacterium]
MKSNESLKEKIIKVRNNLESENIPIFPIPTILSTKNITITNPSDLIKYIEHTALKSETTIQDIIRLCHEAKENSFFGVCINPVYVSEAKKELENSNCLLISVVGFPLGMNLTQTKVEETKEVIEKGADEVDMVISIGLMKSREYKKVFEDIRGVVVAAKNKSVKVIIETCLLDEEEKIVASLLVKRAGASFVKTSTGFNKAGALVEDIKLIRASVGDDMGIKAAGGIRDFETAKAMIEAGANRLGCSASSKIVKGW